MDLSNALYVISYAAIPVLFAITVHEVAHGWVARHFGDRTAEAAGRLTLNPVKHIDPIGTVLVPGVLLLLNTGFLFGWAKPVPVNPRFMRNPRSSMAWVSAAGPGVNFLMAVFWVLLLGLVLTGALGTGTTAEWLERMSRVGVFINVLLAVFNMLPIPPLDGGRVLISALPYGPSRALERIEPFGIFIVLGLLVTGLLWPIMGPVIRAVMGVLFGLIT